MVDYLKKAKKVSKYYPPLQLPTDVSDGVQVANRGPKLKFSAICVPHQYKKLRYRSREKE